MSTAPAIARFVKPEPNKYILVNAGLVATDVMWDGQMIVIPPRNVVGAPGEGRYRLPAARLDGKALAGTAVLADTQNYNEHTGAVTKTMDAYAFIAGLAEHHADLFVRGLTVVSSPEEVADAIQENIALWETSVLEAAREVLEEERNRQKYWTDRDKKPPPASNPESIKEAAAIVEAGQATAGPELSVDAIDALLTPGSAPRGVPDETPATTKPVPVPPAPMAADPETDARWLVEQAKELNVNLLKTEQDALIASLMSGDPVDEDTVESITQKIEKKKAAEKE